MSDEKIQAALQPSDQKSVSKPSHKMIWIPLVLFAGLVWLVLSQWQMKSELQKITAQSTQLNTQTENTLKAYVRQDQLDVILSDLKQSQADFVSNLQSTQSHGMISWQMEEVEFLLQLAQDHLLYTQQVKQAIRLVEEALKIAKTIRDPQMAMVQKAMAQDLLILQSYPTVDQRSGLATLDALITQAPTLLPIQTTKVASDVSSDQTETVWQKTLARLEKIVIIRHQGADPAWMSQDQRTALIAHIQTQCQLAQLSLLQGNVTVYQQSLNNVMALVQTMGSADSPHIQAFEEKLKALKNQINTNPIPTVTASLQAIRSLQRDQKTGGNR